MSTATRRTVQRELAKCSLATTTHTVHTHVDPLYHSSGCSTPVAPHSPSAFRSESPSHLSANFPGCGTTIVRTTFDRALSDVDLFGDLPAQVTATRPRNVNPRSTAFYWILTPDEHAEGISYEMLKGAIVGMYHSIIVELEQYDSYATDHTRLHIAMVTADD